MPSINLAYQWAIQKCNDANVGYPDLATHPEWRNQVTVDGITYYDCSSFIWYALIAGGFDCVAAHDGNTWPFVTSEMGTVLTRLGFHEVSRTGPILAGDIGVHNRGSAGGHTEMCYTGGNGVGVFMGAHGHWRPLADQVSINSYSTSGTDWEQIYRYDNGLNYVWHNKNYGAFAKNSIEAQENVMKIVSILMPLGWTVNAIAGMIGNIEAESGLNPWRWQNDSQNISLGYGLFQYTPASNYVGDSLASTMTGYAPNYPVGSGGQDDGTAQLLYMMEDSVPSSGGGRGSQYAPTALYPLTFTEFQHSTESPEYLASAWLKNFERAGIEYEETRQANARYWFDWINDHGYIPFHTRFKIWMAKQHFMYKKRRGIY